MNVRIREADLNRDGDQIAEALSKYLTPLADRPRFDWLYNRNPHGKVRAWLALDQDDNLIATAAAFPRRVYQAGNMISSWVLGDFCVNDGHRSLGPAVALQRKLLNAVDAGDVSICYDFPSTAMAAVYKRLKIEPFGEMIRMVKLVRVDRKVREYIRYSLLANMVSSVGNVLLRATAFRPASEQFVKVSLQESKCGSEFDTLADRLGMCVGFCVRRSADYINWRYLENPYKKHHLLTVTRDDLLVGFAVLAQNGSDGEIVDIFGEDTPDVISALISEIVEIFRRRGVVTVSAELIDSHPWIGLFKRFGFYPRESKPFMVYAPTSDLFTVASQNGPARFRWFIMGGDRDS